MIDSLSLLPYLLKGQQTRTERVLSLTVSQWPVEFKPIKSGSLNFGFSDFQTEIMPLRITVNINPFLKLNASKDTIWLSGTDGMIRTQIDSTQPIGTPLPENDDAEASGFYVRSTQQLSMIFDLMLPISIKAHTNGKY